MLGLVHYLNDFQEEQQQPRICDRLITCTRRDLASQREPRRLGHPLEDTCPRRTRVPGGRNSSGLTFALIAWENRKLFLFAPVICATFHTVSPVWEPPNSPETQPGPRPHQSGPSLCTPFTRASLTAPSMDHGPSYPRMCVCVNDDKHGDGSNLIVRHLQRLLSSKGC